MKDNKQVVIAAIIGIVLLEALALSKGVNGVLLTAAIGVIAGLAGWASPQLKLRK